MARMYAYHTARDFLDGGVISRHIGIDCLHHDANSMLVEKVSANHYTVG